jgi:2-keto-4-pentenoate hydratase/2-oxohepta-3-ene-1,7-dioic acid hydratase in catechol pathway
LRIANLSGRAALVAADSYVDVHTESAGRFGPSPQSLFGEWETFRTWAGGRTFENGARLDPGALGAPVPEPRQVFAIGLNYRGHAAESGFGIPSAPPTFTKFPSCLAGPHAQVALPSRNVDYEVELVVVIGRRAEAVKEADAWSYVAGLTVGQDLSERISQLAGPVPQFSLAKSFAGFGPIGPVLVTVEEFANPDDLEIGCSLNGETMQRARTSDLIFSVPDLIARLSAVCVLLPGDIIFTGTPAGVGAGRKPPRFLAPSDILSSYIEGIGELRNTFVAGAGYAPELLAAGTAAYRGPA